MTYLYHCIPARFSPILKWLLFDDIVGHTVAGSTAPMALSLASVSRISGGASLAKFGSASIGAVFLELLLCQMV